MSFISQGYPLWMAQRTGNGWAERPARDVEAEIRGSVQPVIGWILGGGPLPIGTRNIPNPREVVFGSTAEEVLREALAAAGLERDQAVERILDEAETAAFGEWLAVQTHRDDPVGKLARVFRDRASFRESLELAYAEWLKAGR